MTTTPPGAAFDRALAFVLQHEGGYSNDPLDPGGETNYGISKRAYPGADIRNLTRDQAADIYFADYWRAGCCEALPPGVAIMHFDACVNQGIGTASKVLQLAASVTSDGKVGPKTLAAVQRMRADDLLTEYAARRMSHYGRLSHFETYGLGWSRRLMACLALCLTFRAA